MACRPIENAFENVAWKIAAILSRIYVLNVFVWLDSLFPGRCIGKIASLFASTLVRLVAWCYLVLIRCLSQCWGFNVAAWHHQATVSETIVELEWCSDLRRKACLNVFVGINSSFSSRCIRIIASWLGLALARLLTWCRSVAWANAGQYCFYMSPYDVIRSQWVRAVPSWMLHHTAQGFI